jgi:Fe-Mn family superoxide dismutase
VTRYILPDLRYDYGALEPHLSGQIMELHHDRHHRTYVEKANQAIERLQEARSHGNFENIGALEYELAFNISGHVLHSIFWQNLSPDGGGQPSGALGEAIARDFGSFERFQQQMIEVAATVTGSGWAALVYEPLVQRLGTTQIHDHQSQITQGSVPLLVIDAWEHAYYLQYRTDKRKFFQAVWNLWNWDDVAARFDKAQELDLHLMDVAVRTEVTAAEAPAQH